MAPAALYPVLSEAAGGGVSAPEWSDVTTPEWHNPESPESSPLQQQRGRAFCISSETPLKHGNNIFEDQ